MLDIRFDNARLFTGDAPDDASGKVPVAAQGETRTVGVRDGRIVLNDTLCSDTPPDARRVIDANGAALCPGFIDIHAHSDYAALYAPTALSKVLAGYTTELNGNCGMGAFPLQGPMLDYRQAEYAPYGLTIDWHTVDEYFDRCAARPMALNQGLLLGQGTLRGSICGFDNRPATAEEKRAMRDHVVHAMERGCYGMSTGLVYAPGSFASRGEILLLAEIVAHYGGLYASHLRSESDTLSEALDEFLSVCEHTLCRAQYSHIKAAGPRNWHKVKEVRQRMDAARARGVELYGDRYPYNASCTDLATILLPNDALSGGPAAIVERLRDRDTRAELKRRIIEREQIDVDGPGWYDRVMISAVHDPALRPAEGRTLAKWAAQSNHEGDPLDAAFDLVITDGALTYAIHFSMSDENLREILSWSDVMIGSDACIRDKVGDACDDHPHPRAFGTPARVLGQFARDAGLIDLVTAIHKQTGMPADVMRLKNRGRIRNGYAADLVVFDPDTIADRATYESPAQTPAGIKWVIINGTVVAEPNGDNTASPTGKTPGQLLKFRG